MTPSKSRRSMISDTNLVLSNMNYDNMVQALKSEIRTNQAILVVEDDVNRDTEIVLNLFRDLEFILACYVTLNKTHLFMRQSLKTKRIDASKFFYIDGITRAMSETLPAGQDCIFLEHPQSLDELDRAIGTVLEKKPDFIILDSVSSLMAYHDASEIAGFFKRFLGIARSHKIKAILMVSKADWDKKALQNVGDLVDKIVIMMGKGGYTWPKQ